MPGVTIFDVAFNIELAKSDVILYKASHCIRKSSEAKADLSNFSGWGKDPQGKAMGYIVISLIFKEGDFDVRHSYPILHGRASLHLRLREGHFQPHASSPGWDEVRRALTSFLSTNIQMAWRIDRFDSTRGMGPIYRLRILQFRREESFFIILPDNLDLHSSCSFPMRHQQRKPIDECLKAALHNVSHNP